MHRYNTTDISNEKLKMLPIYATACAYTLDLEKQAPQTAAADVAGAATAELTQPAPPPYTAPKPVLYLPTQK